MALLTLSAGDTVGLSFGSFNIIGTRTGSETVILSNPISGNLSVTLDPSFNQGGDTIVLAGSAADYTIVRSGSSVIMTNGSITVTIPVGTAGANVVFANGAGAGDDDVRVLKFVAGVGVVLDGGIASENQVVGSTVTAVAVNDAPVVANLLADRSVNEDTAVDFTLPANSFSDVDGDLLTLTASGMPAWLSFNAATGTFSGTPPLNFNGAVNVTVTATDPGGLAVSDTFTLTVNPVNDAPVVANALADRSGAEDTAVNFTLPANSFSDVDNASLTLSATLAGGAPLPAWLTFNAATGTFSGTPPLNFNGSLDVTVTASDGSLSASDTFTLTVNPVNDAPVVANALADRSGAEDTAVNFTLPANSFSDVDNASLTLSATLAGGAPLPAWLTFNAATGTFSGTPPLNFNGSLDVTVTASDGSLSASDTFTLTVTPVNDAPVVANALADRTFSEDTPVSFTIPAGSFGDVDGDALTLTATGVPAWLTFNAATGTFSGTPPQDFNGSASVTVTATDPDGLAVSDTFVLTLSPVIDVAVSGASVTEGDPGGPARQVTFTLTLDTVPTAPVAVSYFTTAGTATANDDFVPTGGIVTFQIGQTVAFVSVPIIGDLTVEPNEAFTLSATVVGTPSVFGITSTATGTILENDTIQGTLTAGQDTLLGTENSDIFIGQNRNLNAGDSVTGGAGTDVLQFATDASTLGNGIGGLGAAQFGGFTLAGVEIFRVTNDSQRTNVFDLSGADGLNTVETNNSSAAVEFRNLDGATDTLRIRNLTNDTSDVDVTMAFSDAAVVGGDDGVIVDINESAVNRIRIGSNSDNDDGIENITLNITGDSTVEALDSGMVNLDINGDGSIVIDDLENQNNLQLIDANGASGAVTLSFSNAPGAVTYLGSSGNDTVTGNNANGTTIDTGNGNDTVTDGAGGGNTTITTGAGSDTVNSRSGNDTISTGTEADVINVTSTGVTTVDAGSANDVIDFANGSFNAAIGQDVVNGGADRDELRINQSANDANFANVSSIEVLTLNTGGTTVNLGTEGSEAGIDTINLSAGNDVVSALIDARNLTINSRGAGTGGNDTVTTGSANDTFNFGGNLTDDDDLDGGAGTDVLNLDGPTILSAGNAAFERFETVNLAGNGNNDYSLTLDNLNAPSSNGTLTIAGGTLGVDDTAVINTSAVTLFGLNITTGAAADTVTLGSTANTVSTGAEIDTVTGTIGAGASTIDTGADADTVNLVTAGGGSLNLTTGTGADTVVVTGLGDKTINTGDDNDNVDADGTATIQLGSGEDTLFVTGLNNGQTADGGAGVADLVEADSAVTDALFTNFSNFEVFRQTAATTSVLGSAAQAAGVRTVVDSDFGTNTYDLSAYTVGVTVILNDQPVTAGHTGTFNNGGGGDDTVLTGSGNDIIILDDGAGADDNIINTGAGDDTIISRNDSLNGDDLINGGEGNDTIAFNNGNANTNIPGPVDADIDFDDVVSIENFVFTDSGDRILNVVDADNSVIRFRGDGNPVGTLTNIRVDLSAVTDGDDSVTVVLEDDGFLGLGNGLTDPDFAFQIIGAGTGVDVIVDKQNLGTDNNINFQGGASNDTLRISGIDLGSTITFTGGAGVDSLVQTGGTFTDDGFDNISGVEFLIGDDELDATLGQRAKEAGFTNLVGGSGDDDIIIDAAFDGILTVDLSAGDGDDFNGAASDAVFNFIMGVEATAADNISGGSTGLDTLSAIGETTTGGGITNITGVTGVETINFRTGTVGAAQAAALVFDTNAGEVVDGRQTINIEGDTFVAGVAQDTVIVDHVSKGANDANITINVNGVARATMELGFGNDTINGGANVVLDVRSGAGDDVVNVGAGGQGDISGGDGNDVLNGNSGADILAGGAGNDTISGGAGNDILFGGSGNDTISDGAGADQIYGGAGGDTINLTNDSNVDTIIYDAFYNDGNPATTDFAIDSFGAIAGNFDTINGFVSGTDKIQLVLPVGVAFTFLGNVNSFAAVDSSLSDQADGVQAIYDQVANILYIDLDSDGDIDSEDLQIVVNTLGETGLASGDFANTTVAAFNTPVPVSTTVPASVSGPQADTAAFTNGVFTAAELTVGIAANLQP
jgi:Ca2+-binding RTX toxin-like protein